MSTNPPPLVARRERRRAKFRLTVDPIAVRTEKAAAMLGVQPDLLPLLVQAGLVRPPRQITARIVVWLFEELRRCDMRAIRRFDPEKFHHIIPLRGLIVSGLHVHTNLRIIPAADNLKKGRRLSLC